MRRVLVIAYYFPPLGLSGVQRTTKFVKYLPEYGWQPTVLTVEDRGYFAKDEALLGELEGLPVDIVRTASHDLLHLFRKRDVVAMPSGRKYNLFLRASQAIFIPDNKIAWKKHAMAAARPLLRSAPFDMLYATAPPYTDFLIGAALKKEFRIPLVLDYRDPWLSNPHHYYATPLHRLAHHRLERRALRYADHVVTINRSIKETIVRENPSVSHHDVSIISQGFDPADFEGLRRRPDGKLRITYAGTFYDNRTPAHFLRALGAFLEVRPAARGRVEACFVGQFRAEDKALVARLGLEDSVRALGYLPHRDTAAVMADSDVLWMIIGSGEGAEMMSTGKLYDYIGARKPVLGCVPAGSARAVLEQSRCAWITEPEDAGGIARQLAAIDDAFRAGTLPAPSPDFVAQFDRRMLTGRLAETFARALHLGPHEERVEVEG